MQVDFTDGLRPEEIFNNFKQCFFMREFLLFLIIDAPCYKLLEMDLRWI